LKYAEDAKTENEASRAADERKESNGMNSTDEIVPTVEKESILNESKPELVASARSLNKSTEGPRRKMTLRNNPLVNAELKNSQEYLTTEIDSNSPVSPASIDYLLTMQNYAEQFFFHHPGKKVSTFVINI
jgi:hypothetical protein